MKVVLTGGGTGGHFYPLLAVGEELGRLRDELHLVGVEIHMVAPDPYDERLLFEQGIVFHKIATGKLRRYFAIRNVFDVFLTGIAVLRAILLLYKIFPDVVFSKGGYGSFPTVCAARLLGIPVFLHESDSVPGAVNKWTGKFAARIAVSWESARTHFPPARTALTGNPIRREMFTPQKSGGYEFLKLEEGLPTLLILGGSQGAKALNEVVLAALPRLVERMQIVHQTGEAHFTEVSNTAKVVLENSNHSSRYHVFPYLNKLAMRISAGVATVVLTRAGSTLFEIAQWGIPSIVVPITNSPGNHQHENAFTYARAGAGLVIEEPNLTPHVLVAQIFELLDDSKERERMSKNARAFAKPDAAATIAKEIIKLAEKHESEE